MWLHRLQSSPDLTLNHMERPETMPHIFHYTSYEEFESVKKKDRVTSRAVAVPVQLKITLFLTGVMTFVQLKTSSHSTWFSRKAMSS